VSDGTLTVAGASVGNVQSVPSAANERLLFRFAFVALWLLPIMGFTMPTESVTDAWEPLDLVKLVILAIVCFGGAFAMHANLGHPWFRRIIDPLLTFYVFFAWALLSTLWSPLMSVTIFQCGGLAALLCFATSIGVISTRQKNVSQVLFQLCLVLLASSAVVFVAYLIDPSMSGLNRDRIHHGGDGVVHPTAAGATASLGLLLPTLCHVIGQFAWAKKLLVPSLLIHGGILFLSNSRTATGMAVVTIGFVLFWYSTNVSRAKFVAGIGLLCLAIVLFDPGFKLGASTAGASAEYVTRGQSGDQLKEVSGRSEMWSAIWQEYKKSLLWGHGYFVTSETGSLVVWNARANYTAHNLALQILVSTGAIGFLLFGFSLLQSALAALTLRHGNLFQQRIFVMTAVTAVWYFGWAQLGISFMGPVRPESIVFFTLLGIVVGQATQVPVPSRRTRITGESRPTAAYDSARIQSDSDKP
jgi:O-antigen ligase